MAGEAFDTLSRWVDEAVYTASSPIRQIFDVLLKTITEAKPMGDCHKAFADLQELVTDPVDPNLVLRGEFYSSLFAADYGPQSRDGTFSSARLFVPPAEDTTPELGAKYLFATSAGGVPTVISPIYLALQNASYVAWINLDSARLSYLAKVLSMAAQVQLNWYAPPYSVLTKGSGSFPAVDHPHDDSVSVELALAYDLLFSSFQGDQGRPVRRLLLQMGRNRVLSGLDAQPYRTRTGPGLAPYVTAGTFQIMTSLVLIVQYAVEGEAEGDLEYDSVAAGLNVKGIMYYLKYGGAFDPTGPTREGPGYFMTAMRQASFPILAASRRGHDVFSSSTNFYAVMMDVFQTMAPWSLAPPVYGCHDGAGFCGGFGQSEFYLLAKYVFPDDPLVDFIYQKYNTNLSSKKIATYGLSKMPFQTAVLGMEVNLENISFSSVAEAMGIPLTFFANTRGMGTMRSSWEDSASFLYFESRPDTYNLGHLHSNRNSFYFLGNGRAWIVNSLYHNTENEADATVLIDGVGQGGCHTTKTPDKLCKLWSHIPGKIVETFESVRLSYFAGDASAAYGFVGDGPLMPRKVAPKGDKNPLQTPYAWRDFFLEKPDFGSLLYYNPANPEEPFWVKSEEWTTWKVQAKDKFNPVQYAFRTAAMMKGDHPYAIIVDDIKKDNNAHDFMWVANTSQPYLPSIGWGKPLRMLEGTTGGGLESEAIFFREDDLDPRTKRVKPGTARLLVRVLQGEGEKQAIRLVHVEKGTGACTPGCATAEGYWRMEIERKSVVEPKFKIMLFSFVDGEELPVTAWDNRQEVLTVEWSKRPQMDKISFTKNAEGRTMVRVQESLMDKIYRMTCCCSVYDGIISIILKGRRKN